MASEKILVLGATGGVASNVVSQLLKISPLPSLRVASRDPSKLSSLSLPPSVDIVQGDVTNPASYPQLFNQITKVFLYVVGLEKTRQAVLTAAKEAGVKHIVFLSSIATVMPDHPLGKMHLVVEDAIKEEGFTYTFLRPGGFAANTFRIWGPQIKSLPSLFVPFPNAHSNPIASEDIAAVAVVALTSSSPSLNNSYIVLSGPESLTNLQQIEILSKVREEQKGKKIEYKVVSVEEWKEEVVAKGAIGFPPQMAAILENNWKKSDNIPLEISSEVMKITGKSTTFEEWARIHADELFN